jgi:hypothetical protein
MGGCAIAYSGTTEYDKEAQANSPRYMEVFGEVHGQ